MNADQARTALADLAMRAIDTILEDYGEDAHLTAASLVFEVRTTDTDGDPFYQTNYKSLPMNSTNHIAGMLHGTAQWLWTPDPEDK